MRRPTVVLAISVLLLVSCASSDTVDAEAEAEAHLVLNEHLNAMVVDDWEQVYELAAIEQRPADRGGWIATRQSDGFVHKCVGEDPGRPAIELDTVQHADTSMLVEAVLWVQSDQGRICRWELIAEADGRWRVAGLVPHDQAGREGAS